MIDAALCCAARALGLGGDPRRTGDGLDAGERGMIVIYLFLRIGALVVAGGWRTVKVPFLPFVEKKRTRYRPRAREFGEGEGKEIEIN